MRIFIFCAALIFDRAAKFLAESRLLPAVAGQSAAFFSLRLHHNYGMTFSILRGYPQLCAAFALIAAVLLCFACARNKTVRSTPGVELLLAGALGNLADRFMYGYVIDWIYVGAYVNLADVWIGAGCLIVLAQTARKNRGRSLL